MDVKKAEVSKDDKPATDIVVAEKQIFTINDEKESKDDMVDGWRKLVLSGAKEFKLKLSLQEDKDKLEKQLFNFAAVSSEPRVNDDTTYHQLKGSSELDIQKSEGTVYIKYPVESKYLLTLTHKY